MKFLICVLFAAIVALAHAYPAANDEVVRVVPVQESEAEAADTETFVRQKRHGFGGFGGGYPGGYGGFGGGYPGGFGGGYPGGFGGGYPGGFGGGYGGASAQASASSFGGGYGGGLPFYG